MTKGVFDSVEIDLLKKMETLTVGIGDTDRISLLPESIVHQILSFVNTSVELVRMSVLSKKWFDLTASFPILYFRIDDFRSRESFFKYVEYTTSRFCQKNVPALVFTLITTIREPGELDIVNRCLELVLKNGMRALGIDITYLSDVEKYRLPNRLLSVSMLKSLFICGCDLPSSLMFDVVKFKSLTRLTLESVKIDDEVIKYLTTSCPLLQEFQIRWCPGYKSFCVYGHQNLQKVMIQYNFALEIIDIEAPNLSTLSLSDWYGRGAPRMNLASCKKLTTVYYCGLSLSNSNGFSDFLSNFPFIENLYLSTTYKCNNFKLSSHSLRTLVLRLFSDLEEIELNTPNLVVLNYSHVVQTLFHMDTCRYLLRDSIHLKAVMQYYPDHNTIDALWFHKLRLFLDKKSGFKVLNLFVDVTPDSQILIGLEELKAIELPPYELENVELQLHQESSDHVALVGAILWCCRPQTLIVSYSHSDFEFQSDFIKFAYEKLLQQENQGHTKIQIVSPSSSLLMASRPKGEVISFIKEEETG